MLSVRGDRHARRTRVPNREAAGPGQARGRAPAHAGGCSAASAHTLSRQARITTCFRGQELCGCKMWPCACGRCWETPRPSVDWSLNLPSVASEVREGMAWAAFSWPRSPSPGLHAASCPQAREGCWRCHGRAGKLGGLWGRGAVGRPGGLPSACGSPGGWAASRGVELCWRLNGARFARKGGLCSVKDAFIPTGLPLCYESCEYSLEHLPFS